MAWSRWVRWLVAVLLALGVLAATSLLTSSIELYTGYRPSAPGVEPFLVPDAIASTLDWVDREDAAAAALSVLSALALVGSVVMMAVRKHWSWGVAVLGSLAGTAGAAASIATASTVRWEQLALNAVMTGTELSGYEAGTQSSTVRFVLTDGQEMSTADFGQALTVHMVGPVLALVGLAVGLVAVVLWGGGQPVWRRTKDASSSTASTASGNAG